MTNDLCISCTRPASYYFQDNKKKYWYCGYCASYIATFHIKNNIDTTREKTSV
jgi:hypothetical protein